jgi:hypothetical protein
MPPGSYKVTPALKLSMLEKPDARFVFTPKGHSPSLKNID